MLQRGATTSAGIDADLWVAANGDDLGPGTGLAPFKTIARARTAARLLGRPCAIGIRGSAGINYVPSTLSLTSADSGISLIGAPGESPTLSGGSQFSATWTSFFTSGSVTIYRAPCTLSGFRNIWVNGVRVGRAITTINTSGWTLNSGTGVYTGTIAAYAIPADLEFIYKYHWTSGLCPVASISGSTTTMGTGWADVYYENVTRFGNPNVPNYISNAIEILKANLTPGMYLDHTNNFLYMIPPVGVNLNIATVIIPAIEQIISATGVIGSTIQGLTFSHTTFVKPTTGYASNQCGTYSTTVPATSIIKQVAALSHRDSQNILIRRNTFTALGGAGLTVDGVSTDIDIAGNIMIDISGVGFFSGDPSQGGSSIYGGPTRLAFHSNMIRNVGVEYWDCGAMWHFFGRDINIHHNIVHDSSYTGISVGEGVPLPNANVGIQIHHNELYNIMILNGMDDGGGIYCSGSYVNALVYSNYVHDIGFNAANPVNALYIDDYGLGLTETSNVLVRITSQYCAHFHNNVGPNSIINTITDWSGGINDSNLMHVQTGGATITPNIYTGTQVLATADAIAAGLALGTGIEAEYL